MPGGDGTGPLGTFRNCMPVAAQGSTRYAPLYGRRYFARGGFGRGFRRRFIATGMQGREWFQQGQQAPIAEQTKENEIKSIEQEMESLKRRLEELKKEA
ncbi:MAG: DUF5320 domain-containing protein [Candidatus Diapherotrites archaeon]|uniref:DUF5320 domain-containing protein n=1 Tax=Candidatus Iainarchaeum sp. TaxID=3101447 RepID=A0A938YUW1_9ARCH|nr:DUF5320 domain-containing protein [Candidatus Diapherotrites archaeon]